MKKLLIAVDVVNDFVDGSLGTPEAVAILPNVIAKIREYEESGDGILFLRDTHDEGYLRTQEGKNLPVPHTLIGSRGWLVADAIRDVIDTDKYLNLEKDRFACTDLELFLKEIEEPFAIELIGICTGICVISNAFYIKALYPEAPISVDARCCACVTPETHQKALDIMKLCQVEIIGEG